MTSIDDHEADRLSDEVIAATDEEVFGRLVAAKPQVLDPAVEQQFLQMAEVPVYGVTFRALADLVRNAREDVTAAWAEHERWLTEVARLGGEGAALDAQIETAIAEGRSADALALIPDAMEKAATAGLGGVAADLHLRAGQVLIRGGVAERDREVEAAITEFKAGLELAGSPEQSAVLLMHLGLAGPERVRGDRRENTEEAIEILQTALDALDSSEPNQLDACIRTNLASVMLGLETEDVVGNLRQALALVRTSLEFRSVERDATDWAYSQVNLGLILDRLDQAGVADADGAEEAWQAVVDESERCPSWLVGHAHHGLGQRLVALAQPPDPQLDDEDEEDGRGGEEEGASLGRSQAGPSADADDEVDLELLERGCDHLRRARTLLVDSPDQLARGRALNDLAGALGQLEEIDESIAAGHEALELLGPTTSPRDTVSIAYRLGSQLADRAQWEDASAVFRQGVLGAEIAIDTRIDPADRRSEAERAGSISRWASYCLAKAGEPVEAALALENGRTREARRRLGITTGAYSLDDLPSELKEAYETALHLLRKDRLDGSGPNASRALQEAIYRIREQPGWEGFGAGTDEDGLVAALEPDWPLLYVSPTPWGTALLLLKATAEGAEIACEFIAATSLDAFLRLMAGDAAEDMAFDDETQARSYFFGISTDEPDHDLQADIEQALPWLGESFGQPIAQLLRSHGLEAVTLIVCGPLGLAPLHAAPWGEPGRCLLDEVDVRFGPSAVVQSAAIKRAEEGQGMAPQLLAVADPHSDLPAATAEVEEVAQYFASDQRQIFQGADATADALIANADAATHIHLACHAQGGLFEADESAVELAGRGIAALELSSLVGLQTRLVTISACRSAMAGLVQFADEVFSFGGAVLAAGSACSIATLWPVDDAATALLMTKMYEELAAGQLTPPQALRRAQLWLRDLTPETEAYYLSAHPALEAEWRRRTDAGRPPGRPDPSTGCRFSHPDYWASFIASGA